MFESLMVEKRERRIAQPMLSFAIHASLLALVVGAGAKAPIVTNDPDAGGPPIYVLEQPIPHPETEAKTGLPLPRPECECDVSIPGPVIHDDFTGRFKPISQLPGSNPLGAPVQSILDPGPMVVTGVYREEDLTDSPVIVHFPQPVYPPALKSAGVEGVVQAIYVVDTLGRVEPGSITIVTTDHPFMAESVRTALRGARFQPGRVRGTAVRSLVRQTVRFSLMSL